MAQTGGDADKLLVLLKKKGYPDATRQQVHTIKWQIAQSSGTGQAPEPEPKLGRRSKKTAKKLAEIADSGKRDISLNLGTMPQANGHDPAGAGAKPNGVDKGEASTPATDAVLSLAERRANARAKIAEGLAELEALEPETLEAEGKIERLKGVGVTLVFAARQEIPPSTQ